jgi:ribonucleoside-diphosphate reductase alpha chain
MDYIFRYLSIKFLDTELSPDVTDDEVTADPNEAATEEAHRSGPAVDTSQAELDFGDMGDGDLSADDQDELIGQTVEAFMDAATQGAEPAQAEAVKDATSETFQNQSDAPPCPECGSITVRNGSCYMCPNCGSSTGCG